MVKITFQRIVKVLQMIGEYAKDFWIFLRYNGHSPLEESVRRRYFHTVIETHTIEKGLSLTTPRPLFGKDKIRSLLRFNRKPVNGMPKFPREMLAGALSDYRDAFTSHAVGDRSILTEITEFLDMEAIAGRSLKGGVKLLEPPNGMRDDAAVRFLRSRFSSRMYALDPLTDEEVTEVARLAQSAPSQCNRQSTRLHVFRTPSKLGELLELQGGAKGFLEEVPALFIVTSEVSAWGGPQQRNQPYVDGGLFAMMLLMSLSAHGFVSCPLNLAVGNNQERKIKRAAGIHSRERLIMMVAAGRPPKTTLKAAKSPRRPVDEIVSLDPGK